MSKIWNRLSFKKESFGGGVPVWINPPKRKIIGALVSNPLRDGEKISAATPVEYTTSTHTAKFLKAWEVVDVDSTSGDITLKITKRSPELYAGMNVMIAPSTVSGTGTGYAVTTVTEDAANGVVVINETGLEPDKGDFLVEASKAGATASMYCIPTELSIEDTIGGDITFVGIAQGNKYLYENTIPAMPDIVKANIKNVEWEVFNEINS